MSTDWKAELQFLDPYGLVPCPDATIWRYMNFQTFVSMLHERALFFRRLDSFRDQHEAVHTKAARNRLRSDIRQLINSIGGHKVELPEQESRAMVSQILAERGRKDRAETFVNCWHQNQHESLAMWEIYSGRGIAIRSNINLVYESIGDFIPRITPGKVQYVDHREDDSSETHPYFFKPRMYSYEQEVRFLFLMAEDEQSAAVRQDGGILVPCALETMMQEVLLAPQTKTWFQDAVTSVLKKYDMAHVVVSRSEADRISELLEDDDK